jgi:hypothetical protein
VLGLTDFLIQAAATLSGALAAFWLEASRQKRKERNSQVARMKQVLFTLISQRTFLRNLEAQHLEPLRSSPLRAFLLHPVTTAPTQLSVQFNDLTFLLDVDDKDILNLLEVADLRFRSVLSILEARNRVHFQFQDRTEGMHRSGGPSIVTQEALKQAVGPVMMAQLTQLTDQLFESCTSALNTNREVYERLDSAFRAHFPREQLFRVKELPLPHG